MVAEGLSWRSVRAMVMVPTFARPPAAAKAVPRAATPDGNGVTGDWRSLAVPTLMVRSKFFRTCVYRRAPVARNDGETFHVSAAKPDSVSSRWERTLLIPNGR